MQIVRYGGRHIHLLCALGANVARNVISNSIRKSENLLVLYFLDCTVNRVGQTAIYTMTIHRKCVGERSESSSVGEALQSSADA